MARKRATPRTRAVSEKSDRKGKTKVPSRGRGSIASTAGKRPGALNSQPVACILAIRKDGVPVLKESHGMFVLVPTENALPSISIRAAENAGVTIEVHRAPQVTEHAEITAPVDFLRRWRSAEALVRAGDRDHLAAAAAATAATTATAASTTTAAAAASTVQAALRGSERRRQDRGESEDEDPEGALPYRACDQEAVQREEEEPRGRPEPASGQEAGQRRQGQPDCRQGREESLRPTTAGLPLTESP